MSEIHQDADRINRIEIEQRILREKFEQHQKNFERHISVTEQSVKALSEAIKSQKEATDGLKETLKMLQYLMMGGIATLIVTKTGLIEGLKFLL